jgi:hypothetical protein
VSGVELDELAVGMPVSGEACSGVVWAIAGVVDCDSSFASDGDER